MKKDCLLLVLVIIIYQLGAMVVPFSELPLVTDANLLPPMQRVNPQDGALERIPTKVWLWQNEQSLCFVFEAAIDSSFTPGPVSTRDTSNTADYMRLQLITLPDAYYAYLFNFYATGNLYDAVRETGRADKNFNTGYSYTSTVQDSLWRIQGQIPLSELRFKQHLPYQWKIIVTRHYDHSLEDFNLPPVKPDMNNDYFAKAFDIELAHPVKRKLDLAFRPYFVKSYDLQAKTDSFDPDNVGIDLALHPAQRTRIKLSINPDFSDTPPDDAADIYNSKYPRFYTENRFFFTEDLNAFGVAGDIFYSRSIVDPSLAFKATGNSTYLNWGVMAVKDKEIVENGHLRNTDDYFQVLSFIPHTKMLTLSTVLVSRMNKDYYNHLLDTYYHWDINNDIRLGTWNSFSVKDDDRDGESETLWGSGHNFSISLTPGNWNMDAYTTYLSRNIYADAGYMNERFFHKFGSSIGWDSEESLDFITNQGFSAYWEYYDYYAKHNLESEVNASYYIYLQPKINLTATLSQGRIIDLSNIDHQVWEGGFTTSLVRWQPFNASVQCTLAKELVYSLADTYFSSSLYGNVWGTLKQVFGYDLSCTLRSYDYAHGTLADYGGLLPYTIPLDNRYVICNGELSYTPHQKLRLACGSGFTSHEDSGIFGNLNLYGNLRYEFKPENFLYMGFNNNQLQDLKFNYTKPLGHFEVDTATAYAKISLSL